MPTLASSSRAQLAYIREATLGTTPNAEAPLAVPPRIAHKLRMTGESLQLALTTTSSNEIRDDRMTPDTVLTGSAVSGGFNFEFSYQEYDPFLASALQSNWSVLGTDGVATVTANLSGNDLEATAGTPFSAVAVGQWVRVTDTAVAGNSGVYRVSAVTGGDTLTLVRYNPATRKLDGTFTFTSETATAGVKVSGSRIKNGTLLSSFTIEKRFSDIAQMIRYAGMSPSKLSLNLASSAIVTGSFDFMGTSSAISATTGLPATGTDSMSYPVMNAVTGVGSLQEAGVDLSNSTFVKSMTLQLDNNLRGQEAIGVLGYAGIGAGTLKITGQVDAYFANGDLYTKFLNSEATSLSLVLIDSTTGSTANGYAITLPKVKFTSGQIQAGGLNQDVMVQMGYEAIFDPATASMILMDRFGAAASLV